MPMDCGSMPGCGGEMMMDGGSCGLPGWSNGVVCPNCQHQVMPSNSGPTTYESYESAEPAPTPATPPVGSPEHNAQIFHQQAIPGELHGGMQPIPVPRSSTPAERPPAPPVASPTSGVRPSDYYAPNKPVTHLPAPAPVTGPVKLTSPPPQWETSLTIEPLHQAGGIRLPPLP
ncbi:MAG: hypothetical protein KF774_15570 [Planctomyces sp.]|nr:hypothetical protein [Planctomyces sp.]